MSAGSTAATVTAAVVLTPTRSEARRAGGGLGLGWATLERTVDYKSSNNLTLTATAPPRVTTRDSEFEVHEYWLGWVRWVPTQLGPARAPAFQSGPQWCVGGKIKAAIVRTAADTSDRLISQSVLQHARVIPVSDACWI